MKRRLRYALQAEDSDAVFAGGSRFSSFVRQQIITRQQEISRSDDNNQGLRGSASPVLTATGFVNGRGQLSTPRESTPFDRLPKYLLEIIMSAIHRLCQIWCKSAYGVLLCEWVKYSKNFYLFIYLYLFS